MVARQWTNSRLFASTLTATHVWVSQSPVLPLKNGKHLDGAAVTLLKLNNISKMNSKWHRIRKNDHLELYSHVSGLQVYHSNPNATSDSALLRVTFCISKYNVFIIGKNCTISLMHWQGKNRFILSVWFSESPTSNDTGIPHALEHLVFMPEPENAKCSSIDEFASLRLCTTVNGFTYDDHTW